MEILDGRADIDDLDAFIERVGEIGDDHGVTIQTFDARYVADAAHLRRAVDNAVRAIERGEAIADDPGVEILLYAAGRRQIDRALEMGVSTGECPVVAVVVNPENHDYRGDPTGAADRPATDAERDAVTDLKADIDPESTLDGTNDDQLRSYFDSTEQELAATKGTISDLVRERVALLVVER